MNINQYKNHYTNKNLVIEISTKELRNIIDFIAKTSMFVLSDTPGTTINQQIKIEKRWLHYSSDSDECLSQTSFYISNSNLEFDWIDAKEFLQGLKTLKIPTFTKVVTIEPLRSKVLKSYDFEDMNPIQFVYPESLNQTKSFSSLDYGSYIAPSTIFNVANIHQEYLL